MPNGLDAQLEAELQVWRRAGRERRLSPRGEAPLERDFTSNDILGHSRRPEVVEAARAALAQYGVGGRASRMLGGGTELEVALEEQVARWVGTESALLFPSGYQANLALLGTLAAPRDVIFSDALNHASLIDGARLSRARVRVYGHLELEELDRALAQERHVRRRLVVTESVFSMDGDLAPLAELLELCERHDAHLIVDEAHALGLLGPRGSGACREVFGDRMPGRLAALTVCGGKALGVTGALIAGSSKLRDLMLHRGRPFVFTTATSPAIPSALAASIEAIQGDSAPRETALSNARHLAEHLGLPAPAAAIVPVVLGDETRTVEVASQLQSQGFDVRAVRPPTVPAKASRLRVVCHAHNPPAEVEALAEAIQAAAPELREDSGTGTAPATVPAEPRRTAAPTFIVAGTDTGIGKTVVSAVLVSSLAQSVRSAESHDAVTPPSAPACRYWKPVQTGDDDDTLEVAQLSGTPREHFADPGLHYPLPASPHEAAADVGAEVDVHALTRRFEELRHEARTPLVAELAGGLLVPLTPTFTNLDWLAELRLPIVLAARSGLGTLNHTLLTLEALRRRHLEPRMLVLVGDHHPSNFATLANLGQVEHQLELPLLDPLDAAAIQEYATRLELATRLGH